MMGRQDPPQIITGIIGHIRVIDSSEPPDNWALCDGRSLPITDHPALFAILGARFGGDGITTFALPDLNDEHRFAICIDGLFPRRGVPPSDWQPTADEAKFIKKQVRAFIQAYKQGYDPLGQHPHVTDLDPTWLERQTQVLLDAYAQGRNPLHRHPHIDNLDPEWVEQQAQVLLDAYGQGHEPLHRHPHVSHLDPEWLERQAQVLVDAYSRHSHPLQTHTHVDDLDPTWLERQTQVLLDAYAQYHDPHHRHPHVSHLDDAWLAAQADAVKEAEPDDLQRIEGIGPKIANTLAAAGMTTFRQLAGAKTADLRQILRDADVRIAFPESWPEQAALAADGRWQALARLQKTLKGGRRA